MASELLAMASCKVQLASHCSKTLLVILGKVVKWRCPNQTLPPNSDTGFQKKVLYLESIGIDSFSLIENHPKLVTASLDDIKSTVKYITGMDFSTIEFRRLVGMCPEILTTKVSDIIPVFTFLHREVRVNGSNIKHVYHSSFVDDEGVNRACGCPLLPLKSHIKGHAPVSDQDRTDIVDEAITFFRANVFFRNFNIESPADKLLIYLTFYINAADKLLIALHTIER
ncbi:ARP2/3 complex ARPC3, 21 kDa subunit, partial [Medicago truncatula]